jgi:5-methylcytosine-specific restriction protein B
LEYGDEVWALVQKKLSTELSPEDADNFFKQSDQFKQIKPPTQKIAGYVNTQGAQLALDLDNKKTTLYFKAGDWINTVKDKLQEVVSYPAEKTRSSNLAANAPHLAQGNSIVKVVVPTMAALIEVCDAYDNDELLESEPATSTSSNKSIPMQPLNQILYGPPGTGKTYATIDEALRILDPEFLEQNKKDRAALKTHFDSFTVPGSEYVRFVTFHQSFSYEDFVEGLRAKTNDENEEKKLEY